MASTVVDPRLARGGYSAEQVHTWLHTSGLRHGVRYDLLDTSPSTVSEAAEIFRGELPKVGELGTVIRKSNPTVTVTGEQKITGTFKLSMLPDDRLRDTELQWAVKPVYLLEIPGGDRLEFDCGVYVYDGADRTLDPRAETWDLQLGDFSHWMDTQSVLLGGFGVPEGGAYTDALKVLLLAAGLFDLSGIEDSPVVAAPPGLLWGYDRPPSLGWTGFWYFNNQGTQAAQIRTTTMLDIAGDINHAVNHYPPFWNRSGVMLSKAFHDLRTTPVMAQFGTAKDSITFRDMTTKSDRTKISNFVFAYTENPGSNDTFVGTADANAFFPNHPWAENKIGHYITRSISSPFVTDWESAQALAFQALTAGLCYNQTITYETMAHPTLEAYDVNNLYLAGDHEIGTPTPYIKVGYQFDLEAGRMKHTDRRIVMPIGDIGPLDVGFTEAWNTFALGTP